ncbi:AlpA family transcriptional regulator [Massilia sp. Root418]|uniref:helix-turn-helix transcriptional regulator n=1 Tax=Massilia sp. Root418 TaxID=1736532 RepID=UPI0009E788CC|nr:AlpA family phage regulatory protein [Massilia sp. Root418]
MNSPVKRIYVDLPEVASVLSLATATIQKLVRQNEFPPPRKLSAQRVGWLLREVEAWAEERPVSDLPPPPNTGSRKGIKRAPTAQDGDPGA